MSRLYLPSASALTRAIRCAASCVIAAGYTTSPWAERGRTIHRFIMMLLELERTMPTDRARAVALDAIAPDDPARRACEALDPAVLPRGGLLEVAFALNCMTGEARILGQNIERQYVQAGLLPEEYPGSADFAGPQDDIAVVVDWKSGWWTPPARDSWQGRLLGLAAAKVWNKPRTRFAHLNLRDGDPRWDIVEFDEFHMLETETVLHDLAGVIDVLRREYEAGRELDVHAGDWCTYCPAFDRCPQKTGLARAMLPELTTIARQIDALSADDLALLVRKIEQYDEVRNRIWQALEERARQEPIRLGTGRTLEFAPGRAEDEIRAPGKALRIVSEMCDQETADRAMTTTKGKITEAVHDWAKENGRPIGRTQNEVIAELRRCGAIKKVAGEEKVRIVQRALPENASTK